MAKRKKNRLLISSLPEATFCNFALKPSERSLGRLGKRSGAEKSIRVTTASGGGKAKDTRARWPPRRRDSGGKPQNRGQNSRTKGLLFFPLSARFQLNLLNGPDPIVITAQRDLLHLRKLAPFHVEMVKIKLFCYKIWPDASSIRPLVGEL